MLSVVLSGQKSRTSFLCAVFLSLPLMAIICWHSRNLAIPNDDAANLMTTTVEIGNRAQQDGIAAGLKAAYLHRGWRPVSFPVFGVPAWLMFGPSLRISVAVTLCGFLIVLMSYTWLSLRLTLGALPASIATAFLGTTPWVLQFSEVYFTEIAMLAATVAAAYHAHRAKFWSSWGHSIAFGVAYGMALTIRPVEVTICTALPLLALLGLCYRRGAIRRRDLVAAGAAVAALVILLCARLAIPTLSGGPAVIVMLLLIALFSGLVIYRPVHLNQRFATAVLVVMSIVGLWWVPGIRALYGWVYETSFGPMAHLLKGKGDLDLFQSLSLFVSELGGYQLALVLILAVLAVCSARLRWFGTQGWIILAIGVAAILPPVIIVALAPGSDVRRGMLGIFGILLGLSIVALHRGSSWNQLRTAILAGCTLLQFGRAVEFVFADDASFPRIAALSFLNGYHPARPREDTNVALLDQVNQSVQPGSVIGLYTAAIQVPTERVFCPAAMSLVSATKQAPQSFQYVWNCLDVADGYRQLQNYHALVVDTFDKIPVQQWESDPYMRQTRDLLARIKNGEAAAVGWRVDRRIVLGDREVLLLKPTLTGTLALRDGKDAAATGTPWATCAETGYHAEALNDGTRRPWGSDNSTSDVYVGVTLARPIASGSLRLMMFSPGGVQHMCDLRIIATCDGKADKSTWHPLRARLGSAEPYVEKLTLPPHADEEIVAIEIDPESLAGQRYSTYAVACLRDSCGDRPSYHPAGRGVYLREIQIEAESDDTAIGSGGEGEAQVPLSRKDSTTPR